MPQSASISKLIFYAIGMVGGSSDDCYVVRLFHDSITFGMRNPFILDRLLDYLTCRTESRNVPTYIYFLLSSLKMGIKSTPRFFLIVVHIFFLCSGTLQFARSMNKDAIDIGCMGRFSGFAMYLLKFWSSTAVLVLISSSYLQPSIFTTVQDWVMVSSKSDGTNRGFSFWRLRYYMFNRFGFLK